MEHFRLRNLSKILWAALLISLPVTSFRFIPFLGAGTFVRPLAIYPLVLLLPVLLLRVYKKDLRQPFPSEFMILLLLGISAVGSFFLGAFHPPIALGGVDYFDRALRALVTLGLGAAFYVAAAWSNQDVEDGHFTVRWLMVGLLATIVWSGVQFYGLNHNWRPTLTKLQALFSARGLVKNKRVSGFAYEPSWLAGQIVALYMPWLFAALIVKTKHLSDRIYNWLAKNVPSIASIDLVNLALFACSLIVILFTYSRSGLVMTVITMLITYFFAGKAHRAAVWAWFMAGFIRRPGFKVVLPRILSIILIVAVLIGAASFLMDKGYIAAFANTSSESVSDYITAIYLGPRIAYLQASLAGFTKQPFFGVGPGASGFYIYQNIPIWALAGNPEVARQLSPSTNIFPNPKNLPVKLLAENGLIGFGLYLVFLLSMVRISAKLLQGDDAQRWIGCVGIFSITAIFMLGFSQDSFAMPELWIIPGILTGIYNFKNISFQRQAP